MNASGLLLIGLGLGLLWSAGAYADDAATVAQVTYARRRSRGVRTWLAPLNRSRRFQRAAAYTIAGAVLVAGLLNLVGVYSL